MKTNNPVAKYNFNKGGFHTPKKHIRRVKHKSTQNETKNIK